MLKLRKVQILGFKSFCDRTEVQLAGEGIAAIVGPNGCGKSNISDAITWVLGEQSAKSLRGVKMEDVIFAGTRDRKSTGMAEVSLTLVDPEVYDGHMGGSEGPELVISDRETLDLPEDWSEEDLRRQTAADTEERVAEAQPGVPLDDEATLGPREVASTKPDSSGEAAVTTDDTPAQQTGDPYEAPSDAVVLRIRRRRFNRAPVRAGEITVTRRLFRTGDSEYLLNDRICRLRDIQDIFMGTGLGGESYAMIGQERIGQLLSSKPLDRRSIIEEAAGITRFKTKKRLAELRLESARQNLARVNDIFDEITRQMSTLKRQAAKAERYGALRDELRRRLRLVLASRMAQMDSEQQLTDDRIAALSAEIDGRAADLAQNDAEHTDGVRHGYELDEQIRSANRTTNGCAVELERVAARTAANTDRVAELADRIVTAREEAAAARTQQASLTVEQEQQRNFLETATGEAAAAAERARRQQAEAQDAARATIETDAQVERGRRNAMQLIERAGQTRAEQAQAEAALAALDRESERLLGESETARQELVALGLQRGQVKLSFESVSDRLRRLESEIATFRLDAESKRALEAERRRTGDALRRQLATEHGRQSSIEGLIRDHSYSTDTVKNVFRSARQRGHDTSFVPLGTLADFLEVEGQYGAAVDELLREELNFIVVRNWDAADEGLRLLKADVAGRATFLVQPEPAGNVPDPKVAADPQRVQAADGLLRLSECVRVPDDLSTIAATTLPKLRDGFVARDAAQARALAEQYPQAWFVTPAGETFHGWSVTGGRATSGGPLALKRELREVEERSDTLTAELARCDLATAALGREILQLTSAAEARIGERREAEREAANSGAALHQMESETARIERRLQEWQLASERNRDQRGVKTDAISRCTQRAEVIETERGALDETLNALQTTLEELRLRRQDLQDAASAAAAHLAGLEERQRTAQSSFDQTSRLLTGQINRLDQLEAQMAAAVSEKLRREQETATLQVQHAELAETRENATAEIARLTAEAAALRSRIAELDHSLRVSRAEIESMREHRAQHTVRAARLASDLEHLDATCRNDLGAEPGSLRADISIERIAGDVLAAEEEHTRALKQRLEAMGPVNMMALEEYTEASERHRFLEAQRNDLLASIENTQASIREIDDVSRTKFDHAFAAINENFSVTFAKLFGGGQALMRLTDSENAAESGIDIVASPPGKKLQNLLLLSGGEKALTALSLLVGIFQFQPAPFCVLDEVDAPLDETNVGRFAKLIAEMSAATQFIVITHSKRTMQQADVIYGVTMQEPGVSKIVSVNLGDRRSKQTGRRAVA